MSSGSPGGLQAAGPGQETAGAPEEFVSRKSRVFSLEKGKDDYDVDYVRRIKRGLSVFDYDGDGHVDLSELKRAADYMQEKDKEVKTLRRFVLVLVFFLALQAAATFGLVYAVVALTRDSYVRDGNSIMPRSAAVPDSVEQYIHSTPVLTSRNAEVVSTGQFFQPFQMSSLLPDSAFATLGQFVASSNTSQSCLAFRVDGFVRVRGGRFGSLVRLFTRLGVVTLDGRTISFDDQAVDALRSVGYTFDSPGSRRLLDLGTDIVGFFNRLVDFDLDALEAAAAAAVAAAARAPSPPAVAALPNATSGADGEAPDAVDAPPASPPPPAAATAYRAIPSSSFTMEYTQFVPCDAPGDPMWCMDINGGLNHTEVVVDMPGMRFFANRVQINVSGSFVHYIRSFSYSPHLEISASNGIFTISATTMNGSGSTGGDAALAAAWVDCSAGPVDSDIPVSIFGWITAFQLAPSFVDNSSSVRGVPARHFLLTNNDTSVNPLGLSVHYYDSVSGRTPLRLLTSSSVFGGGTDDVSASSTQSTLVDITMFAPLVSSSSRPDSLWEGPGSFDTPPSCPAAPDGLLLTNPAALYPVAIAMRDPATQSTTPVAGAGAGGVWSQPPSPGAPPAAAAAGAGVGVGRRRRRVHADSSSSLAEIGNTNVTSLARRELLPQGVFCYPFSGGSNWAGRLLQADSYLVSMLDFVVETGLSFDASECTDGTVNLRGILRAHKIPGAFGQVDINLPRSGRYYKAGATGMAPALYGEGCVGFRPIYVIPRLETVCKGIIRAGTPGLKGWCQDLERQGVQMCYGSLGHPEFGSGLGISLRANLPVLFGLARIHMDGYISIYSTTLGAWRNGVCYSLAFSVNIAWGLYTTPTGNIFGRDAPKCLDFGPPYPSPPPPRPPLPPLPPSPPSPAPPRPLGQQTCASTFGAPCSAWFDSADASTVTTTGQRSTQCSIASTATTPATMWADCVFVSSWSDKSGAGGVNALHARSGSGGPSWSPRNSGGFVFNQNSFLGTSRYTPSFNTNYTVCYTVWNSRRLPIGGALFYKGPTLSAWSTPGQKKVWFGDGTTNPQSVGPNPSFIGHSEGVRRADAIGTGPVVVCMAHKAGASPNQGDPIFYIARYWAGGRGSVGATTMGARFPPFFANATATFADAPNAMFTFGGAPFSVGFRGVLFEYVHFPFEATSDQMTAWAEILMRKWSAPGIAAGYPLS